MSSPDSAVQAEAEKILNSTQPLVEVKKHLDNIIAGEDENKQLIFLLLLSGKVPDPKRKQMILLKGPAGTGKTTLMNIADLFKTKTIARLSETALDYIEDLESYEVLKLQELAHMDYDRPLKFVSADDGGYNIEITVPSRQEVTDAPAPPFKTFTRHIPAITLITSTTRLTIEPQFRRRNWTVVLDESKEQTEKIRAWKVARARERDRLNQGLIRETNYIKSKRILKALVEMIEPCEVIIPFKNFLTQLLPSDRVEVRGHYDKLLTLVHLHGVLLQKQLPKLNERPILTPDRALEALDIAKEAFDTMSSTERRVTALLNVLDEMGVGESRMIDKSERVKLGKVIHKSPRTVLTYLNFLEDEGYLEGVGGRGGKVHTFLTSPKEILKRFGSLSSKLKDKDLLKSAFQIESRTYLTELCDEMEIGEEEKEKLLNNFPI